MNMYIKDLSQGGVTCNQPWIQLWQSRLMTVRSGQRRAPHQRLYSAPAEFTMQRERQQGSPRDAGIVQWERKEKWRESCVKRWRDRQSHVTTLLLDYIEFSRANQIARKVKQPPPSHSTSAPSPSYLSLPLSLSPLVAVIWLVYIKTCLECNSVLANETLVWTGLIHIPKASPTHLLLEKLRERDIERRVRGETEGIK